MSVLLLLLVVPLLAVSQGEGTKTGNQSLSVRERYRRLIPYMTFYLDRPHHQAAPPDSGRYQQVYTPYSPYQGASHLSSSITQNYLSVKNAPGRTPARNPFLRPHHTHQVEQGGGGVQTVTHQPHMETGFKPIVSITQSHEIDVDEVTSSPAGSHSHPHPQAGHYLTSTYSPQPHYVVTPQPYYHYQDIDSNSLFNGYDLSKALPHRITQDNLQSSIRTLSNILDILQRANTRVTPHTPDLLPVEAPAPPRRPVLDHPVPLEPRPVLDHPVPLEHRPVTVRPRPFKQHHVTETRPVEPLPLVAVEARPFKPIKPKYKRVKSPKIRYQHNDEYDDEGGTPGKAGVDYPAYSEIPTTRFSCKQQRYKGFFGDPETNCQVWHYCDLNGGQASFLCPNGTIFSQVALTCDWWFNVKCASTAQLYVLNERLYKYILPQKPSFPEDYAGPLVDRYLAIKYQELEEKRKNDTTPVQVDDEEEEERPSYETNLARSIQYTTVPKE